MSKPRVAVFDFACCEGCQLQIVNLEEEILDLVALVEPVTWREAMSEQSDRYDIAIIEGSITRREDAERLKQIRQRAKILIALGACAAIGGVNKLKDNLDLNEAKRCVYGASADLPHLKTAPTRAADEVVPVDYKIHGCPIRKEEFAYVVRCLATGKQPFVPSYPVCVECKARGNPCRYEFNEVCLGVITRAGCGAPCPSAGSWCFGCRGYVDNPNVNAAKDVMALYGLTPGHLKDRMMLFGSRQEPTYG
jgi:coenzyme F420-reducing hydrogenase gamma subunit